MNSRDRAWPTELDRQEQMGSRLKIAVSASIRSRRQKIKRGYALQTHVADLASLVYVLMLGSKYTIGGSRYRTWVRWYGGFLTEADGQYVRRPTNSEVAIHVPSKAGR